MIDPATGWFEIAHIPQGDFNLARVSQRFNSHWLSRYPRPEKIIFDNGSEFKLHFAELVKGFQVTPKPTTVKNLQANAVLERVHGTIKNMFRCMDLDNVQVDLLDPWDDILASVAWAVRSLYHTTLGATPGELVFGRDILFNIRNKIDW